MEQGDTMIALEVLEQLCSRICHDLAGPVGAIRNGLELIEEQEEEGERAGAQALDLIGHSAEQASRRLRLFRLAYGRSTRDGVRGFGEAREAVLDWLAGGRVSLHWPPGHPDDALAARPGLARLLVNLAVLAAEAIPQGGTVSLLASGSAEGGRATVAVGGRGIKWSSELVAALAGRFEGGALGPRVIHAALTGRFAHHHRIALTWETPDPETLTLRLSW